MANVKIPDLTAAPALALASLFEAVLDPGGTPLSRKATTQQILDAGGLLDDVNTVSTIAVGDKILLVDISAGVARIATYEGLFRNITGFTSASAVAASDYLSGVVGGNLRVFQASALLRAINGLSSAAPALADEFLFQIASNGNARKVTGENLFGLVDLFTAFSATIDGAADKLVYWDDSAGAIRAISPDKLAAGVHTIGIPAAALRPRQSNGPAALATTSGASGQPDIPYLAFDGAAAEYATFGPFWLPKSWNAGTLKARMAWRRASGTGAADVVWAIRGLTIGDNESPAQAFGTAATVTAAASTTTANFKFSGFTGDCTLAGSPAKGDLAFIEVYRDGAAGGDTLNSVDAWLSAVELLYTTDARDDA